MARSFNDPYGPLRMTLRVQAVVVGFLLGTLLLLIPDRSMGMWGLVIEQNAWPARLAGAALMGMGINHMTLAGEETMRLGPITAAMMSSGLLVAVFFFSYLQGDLNNLTPLGQIILITVFVLCLATTLLPIRYFRQDLIY